MNYQKFRESQKRFLRCSVCGKDFSSEYDEELKAFPLYHPALENPKKNPCEDRFYRALLLIYIYLHRHPISVPMSKLVQEINWQGLILMKKEMLHWCLCRGYLTVDNLKRVIIPARVADACNDVFSTANLDDPKYMDVAVVMLKETLRKLVHELEPVSTEQIPIKTLDLDLGETTLFDKIDTSSVVLQSEKNKGIVSIHRVESDDVEPSISTLRTTLAKRLPLRDQK